MTDRVASKVTGRLTSRTRRVPVTLSPVGVWTMDVLRNWHDVAGDSCEVFALDETGQLVELRH